MTARLRSLRLWVALSFSAAPGLTAVLLVTTVVAAVSTPLATVGVKGVVDGGTVADPTAVRAGVILVVVGLALATLLNAVKAPVTEAMDARLERAVRVRLMCLVSRIPSLLPHEDPGAADALGSAQRGAWRMSMAGWLLTFLVGTVTSVVTVAVVLWSVSPWFLLVFVPAALVGVVGQRTGTDLVQTFHRLQADQRLVDELHDVVLHPAHGVEVRCSGAGPAVVERLDEVAGARRAALLDMAGRHARVTLVARAGFGLAQGVVIAVAVFMARAGAASVGDVVMLMLLVPQLTGMAFGLMRGIHGVVETLGALAQMVWLEDYARTHSWSDAVTPPPERLRSGIELRDVTFRYGSTDAEPALRDVSLTIPAGSSLALVGDNGAGKSTLVKLLSRLYDPVSGEVLVDGVPLRTIDPVRWRERMSAAFQDHSAYQFLARENVGVGAVTRMHEHGVVERAVEEGHATVVVAELPAGLDTQLGPQFRGGSELSGGQWQRLALARGFMRREPLLMMLDEPTSALDPEAEHAIFERFSEAAARVSAETGGVTVIVSHRMSTARLADRIAVVDGGRVVEHGTH
ncbi:MAG: ABC transporter ATP-binding protein, partial [Lapillicoccus sp.]